MNKALFIDRDGTINHDCPYCKDPKDLRIYDDAVDIIKDFRKRGFLIVIVTNQSGIITYIIGSKPKNPCASTAAGVVGDTDSMYMMYFGKSVYG